METLLRNNLVNQEASHSIIAFLRLHFESDEIILNLLETLYTQAVFQLETQAVAIEEGKEVADVIYPFALLQWINEHLSSLPSNLVEVLENYSDSSCQKLLENPKSYSSTEFIQFLLSHIEDPTQNESQALLAALESGNQEASLLLRQRGCTLLTKVDGRDPRYSEYEGRLPHGITYHVVYNPMKDKGEFTSTRTYLINRDKHKQYDTIYFMKTNFAIKTIFEKGLVCTWFTDDCALELTFIP